MARDSHVGNPERRNGHAGVWRGAARAGAVRGCLPGPLGRWRGVAARGRAGCAVAPDQVAASHVVRGLALPRMSIAVRYATLEIPRPYRVILDGVVRSRYDNEDDMPG